MRVILISPPDDAEKETLLVNRMFEKGLALLHLRKPGYDRERLSSYLDGIDREFHPRVAVHSCYDLLNDYNLRGIHFKKVNKGHRGSLFERFKGRNDITISMSCHSLEELSCDTECIDYTFLSPIFDSISKSTYKAGFDHKELADTLEKTDLDVVALGGCRPEYLRKIKKLGFAGAAFLGAVWKSPDPFDSYLSIREARRQLSLNSD